MSGMAKLIDKRLDEARREVMSDLSSEFEITEGDLK